MGAQHSGGASRLSVAAALVAAALSLASTAASATRVAEAAASLAKPPQDARTLVRWWWFGPAEEQGELAREIRAMHAGGFGGFEIQPVYPMQLDDPARGIRNTGYLSPEFLKNVGFANEQAHALGLRVDITLGSGWPYGGPHIPVQMAASRLRVVAVDIPPGATGVAAPVIGSGERLLASFIGPGSAKKYEGSQLQLKELGPDARPAIAPSSEARVAVFYLASRTGQQVKRPAINAEGFVLDHLSSAAVQHHLQTVAEPLLKAFGDKPPYAVFSDSLEVYGTDWSDDFLAEFQKRRGYDLRPLLPNLDAIHNEQAAAIRHDWVQTQTELVNERYLSPIDAFAKAHGTRFRSQTYGEPAVTMSSNRLVALPEGEGPQFRSFSFTRWATSAGHLYGRNVISAETWTWLHSPSFAATPLDMKAEADRMFLSGVNQFIAHGWPYTPPGTPEPGYSFYAAAVFNDHLPWWNVMPDVNAYLTRVSHLLRQGQPANDVAVLLPVHDAYAEMPLGKVSVSAEMHKFVSNTLMEQVLDAGHNIDYVDPESVASLGIRYPLLVLPHVTRLAPEVLLKIEQYVKQGGKLLIVGSQPRLAPGYRDYARRSQETAAITARLIQLPGVRVVASDAEVGQAVAALSQPDMQLDANASAIGFIHRKLDDGDLYFIANTSNRPVQAKARFSAKGRYAAWWDPHSGAISPAATAPQLDLAPYESRVLVFSDKPTSGKAAGPQRLRVLQDLGQQWRVRFPGQPEQNLAKLGSWHEDPATRYLSGVVSYSKRVQLAATGKRVWLDFGQGTPLDTVPKVPAGMRAMLDSPVREAAVVLVNGQRAGSVWRPPYRIDITPWLKAGENTIEVQVGNSALNVLAGRGYFDHRLLWARYGQRFVPQDTELIAPQPSGLLGPVTLQTEAE
ncbi:glycosyl hydrolase [Massilia sp. TS11]|uniref:glycosyl hydrolase n=1 Tax=Massilia sp. TS11 TaxID=2908003 RepID=UPI001EDA2BF6|nr:glycosyl hydrolase [Massilia sp. TS11]MCG2583930.1 glycoside hydrolase [Massilia sp. TS11]